MAIVAPRSRFSTSESLLTGCSVQVCSNAGRLTFACSVARSRKTICCVMVASTGSAIESGFERSPLNGSGRMGLVELFRLAHFLARHPIVRAPVIRGSADAAAWHQLDADVLHRHFGFGDPPHQHELVEIPHMADAKYLAGYLREARSQSEVVAAKRHVDHVRGVDPLGHDDRAHGVRVPLVLLRAQPDPPPGRNSRPYPLGEVMVTEENRLQALLENQVQGLAQAIEHR